MFARIHESRLSADAAAETEAQSLRYALRGPESWSLLVVSPINAGVG